MGIYSTALKHLIAAGVSGVALIIAIAEMEDTQKTLKNSSAIRQKRYRERNALRNANLTSNDSVSVTSDVTLRNVTDALYTKEVSKKERKESKITASRFSLDALPGDWQEYCLLKRPDLDPVSTFDAFRDWWIAAPGGKGLKADWAATWRTWVRNQKGLHNGNGVNKPTKQDRFKAAYEQAGRDIDAKYRESGGGT